MFFGFNTAVKGLTASQRALYTVNHNINNQTTPGYSKQYIEQGATRAHHLPGIGYIGTGTEITDVKRARDAFVDHKYWNENSPLGEWRVKNESLIEVQKVMGEPSENSFRQYMDDFYLSLENLSTNSGDLSYRKPVIETAQAFTDHIRDVNKRLDNLKKETLYNLETKVKEINQIGSQIAVLNKQIYIQELDGHSANDLRDRREELIDDLSLIVNINVSETLDGKMDVSIGGTSLVHHFNSEVIFLDRETLKEYEDGNEKDLKSGDFIKWENGSPIKLKSGELKGLKDLLVGNGKNNEYRGIPYYMDQLGEFARGYAEKFNEQHKKGYNLDGETGLDFFIIEDKDNPAGSIKVNEEILEDIKKFAAASKASGNNEDNSNLHELIKQREDRKFFDDKEYPQGTPDDFIKSMVSSMAVDSMQADRFLGTQKLMEENLKNKRESISGVSMNEEMSNMVKFQKTYIASSKMVNTLDNLLDVTINRLGLVGR